MRVLDLSDLKAKGIKYSGVHIARLEKAKKFPKHINLGAGNRKVWLEEEIDQYLRERIAERDAPDAADPGRRRGWQCQPDPKPPRRRKAEQPAASASSSPNE
jgi:prophage regulatory protein